ncbi:MAG: hypothetical protein LUE98_19925 [Tannerellaceae bacterium]|nr:hypothetical protein [Tannerellaceae bacterium]
MVGDYPYFILFMGFYRPRLGMGRIHIYYFFFILVLPGLYLITAGIIKPKRIITFDRINGTVTFYGIKWGKDITQKFEKTYFYLSLRNMKYLPIGVDLSLKRNKIGFASIDIYIFFEDEVSAEETFSYLVWYMDKNRPLPPGSALDPYRKKDYKRRKKEGFPPPLYHSFIDTIESQVFVDDMKRNK